MTYPLRRLGQSLEDHQNDVASWVGVDTVQRLNDEHDPLHLALCRWAGVPSHSLAQADDEPHDTYLAQLEETAVMHVHRWLTQSGAGVPA